MKCPYCGAQVSDQAKFCSVCGEALTEQAEEYVTSYPDNEYNGANRADPYGDENQNGNYDMPPAANGGYNEPQYSYDSPAQPPKTKNNTVLIAIVSIMAVIIVVLAVALLVMLFTGRSSDEEKSPVETQSQQESLYGDMTSSQTAVIPQSSASATMPAVSATMPAASTPSTSGSVSSLTPGSYKVATQQDDLNIRSGAGTQHPVVGRVPKDAVVTVTAVNGDWAYITYGSLTGWVSSQYLIPAA